MFSTSGDVDADEGEPVASRLGWTVAWAFIVASATAAGAQPPEVPLALTRLSGPITIDGRPDEAAWQEVEPLPLTMYFPTHRGQPSQRTEIRVGYDDDHLVVSGRFFDDEPEGIRIHSLYRDRWNGDDALAVYVDAFNDNQSAKWFGLTPAGMRFDLLVADDGATLNGSWDGFWDAATTVTDEGWFAEMRIPFSTLGFRPDGDGRAVVGLTVTRLVSRTGERVTFPDIDPAFAFRQPSVAQDVELQGVDVRTPLYVTPYVLGGARHTPAWGEDPATTSTSREAGLDLRWPFSSGLTLDLSVNTDFAQVEADDRQINLDRFPLFFPEKRRFFQERSGLFEFTTGEGGRLFHSRRIGLTDRREVVPVLGGARLVGRIGEWDVGALDVVTDRSGELSRENFGALRLRRRVLNPYSTIGVLGTHRSGAGDPTGAVGVDAVLRLWGDEYLTAKWAATARGGESDDVGWGDRSLAYLRWQRRANRGLAWSAELVRQGAAYDPSMGFVRRRDFSSANLLANWYVFTDDHPRLRRIWPGALAFSTFRNDDGSLESGQYAVWLQWETKSGAGGWIEPKVFREHVRAPFALGEGAEVPAGDYTFADLQLALSMPAGRRLRTSLDARAGTFFDGTRFQVILAPTWNVSPHLELGGEYQYSRLRFDDREQAADLHVARLRVGTAANAKASGNAFVQYSTASSRVDLNLRLRYNVSEGTDLWIVYNEGLRTERREFFDLPRPPLSTGRSLIVKYSHTFGW